MEEGRDGKSRNSVFVAGSNISGGTWQRRNYREIYRELEQPCYAIFFTPVINHSRRKRWERGPPPSG